MNDFKFVSEKYSIHNTQNYRLSIQVNPDGFSLLVVDSAKDILKIVHRQTGSVTNTQKIFRTEEDLIKTRELSFLSCKILFNTSRVTLHPPESDTELNASSIFHAEFENSELNTIKQRTIPEQNINYSYDIGPEDRSFISDFRNNPEVDHISAYFLDYNFQKADPEIEYPFIYTTPGILHFAYIKGSELRYYNVYSVRNNDELLYHIINTLRTLAVKDDSKLFYSGHLSKKDENWKLLNKYHKDIRILPNEFSFELAGEINENYFTYLLKSTGANY